MKVNFTLAGIIVSFIGFAILIYFAILGFVTPNYNYINTPRPPSWVAPSASLVILVGLLLIIQGKRKAKQTPS